MSWLLKSVHRALRDVGMRKCRKGHKNKHEVWRDRNGKEVELAKRGKEVPDIFLHELAWEPDRDLCSDREFKSIVRRV
jgi:hypothetical protein